MAGNFLAYFLRFKPNACLIQVALKTKQAQYVLQNWPVYSLHCDVTYVHWHRPLENKVLPTLPIFSLMHHGSGWQIEPVHQIIAQIKLYEINFSNPPNRILPIPD